MKNFHKIGVKRLAKRLTNLEKGDVINDFAFNPYSKGVTRFSLAIWAVIKKYVDVTQFTKAEMTCTEGHTDYEFTLTHKDGYKFVFHGMGSGYHGEGSRATVAVLQECGFSKPERIYKHKNENWIMKRSTKPITQTEANSKAIV